MTATADTAVFMPSVALAAAVPFRLSPVEAGLAQGDGILLEITSSHSLTIAASSRKSSDAAPVFRSARMGNRTTRPPLPEDGHPPSDQRLAT
jgi:hypothetical protein